MMFLQRVQHPKVQECKDRAAPYWFFRYWNDEVRPGGAVNTTRKRHICGPSKGPKAISRKQAEIIRDDFLHDLNAAPTRAEVDIDIRHRDTFRVQKSFKRQVMPGIYFNGMMIIFFCKKQVTLLFINETAIDGYRLQVFL